jgi:hypothetical protein
VYGNFFPKADKEMANDWRTEPVVICDGGEGLFGVEYDADAHGITRIAFNGYA